MGSNLQITESIEKYIEEYSQSLHPVQKEIILSKIADMEIEAVKRYFNNRSSYSLRKLMCFNF